MIKWSEPRENVLKIIEAYPNEPEMTVYESAVLCGVIAEIKPKKILEVGVAAGGTTAIVMQCLNDLGISANVISCDLNVQYYRDESRKTGFLLDSIEGKFNTISHRFMLGGYLPEFLDEIGDGIDLAIIDTVHAVPGEILDFLAVLPFMKRTGVVILHDVAFSYYYQNCLSSNAVLMSSIVGDRIDAGTDNDRLGGYPNIGGFYLNDDTRKYVINTFSALLLDWEYVPSNRELMIYRNHYQNYYGDIEMGLFDKAVYNNKNNIRNRAYKKIFNLSDKQIIDTVLKEKKVIFWGSGTISRFWEDIFLREGVKIEFIISKDTTTIKSDNDIPIIHPDLVNFSSLDDLIIIMSSQYDKEIEVLLVNKNVKKYCTYENFLKKMYAIFK